MYYIAMNVCHLPYFFNKSNSLAAKLSQEELLVSDT